MGVGRGECNYVLGMRNIFQLKSAKQEREAKFGMQERRTPILVSEKKSSEKARRNAKREEERKERGHASREREGPAGTHAQLCYLHYQAIFLPLNLSFLLYLAIFLPLTVSIFIT